MAKENKLLKELEELAEKLGVKIRYEKTKARGGLCKKNDEFLIIVDKKASSLYKINILTEALKTFDLSDVFLSPKLREHLETDD